MVAGLLRGSERVRLDNLLKDMQSTAKIGGWEYDVISKQLHWTEALYAIHDLPFGHAIDVDTRDAAAELAHVTWPCAARSRY